MPPHSAPNTNSLLHLLNPYSSMSASGVVPPKADPDSPSAMLLRELAGDEKSAPSPIDRDRMSPTPTPRTQRSHVLATPSTSSDDEELPPQSVLFGDREGSRASPRMLASPPQHVSSEPVARKEASATFSPGPFHQNGPPSSSASGSRSRSTSPGPSTMSIYGSGMEETTLGNSSLPAISRHPSTPPGLAKVSRPAPTFRESPRLARPGPPPRSASDSSKQRLSPPRLVSGAGYPDPSIFSPADRKGKGKAKQKAGKRYHAVAAQADDDDEEPAERGRLAGLGRPIDGGVRRNGLNEYEKALWKWVNVDDLDGFLQEVYAYYKGKGIFCIALARVLNLATTFFVISFSTFLVSCIDYSKLKYETSGPNAIGRLDDVLIGQCITRGSFGHMVFIMSITAFYIFQLVSFALSLPRMIEMYRFYTYLLRVPDADIQTLPWPEIVRLIGEIREHNPVTSLSNGHAGALAGIVGKEANKANIKKLDAHDVANRILRQENYLIALFNKDLLDLRVRLPVPRSLVSMVPPKLLVGGRSEALPTAHETSFERQYICFGANTLTRALEWNLRFCLMGYLFDGRGQVRKEFVRERRRKDLVDGLQRRFVFMGVLNAIFAPFIVIYLLIFSFFRNFEEYHKNPSSIGSRQYTPYAQWKFREFNELPHLFERRLDHSYPTAKEYIDQFPKERTALVMRFVAFVAGAFAAVLLVASLLDPDLVLHFEITPHRTVLFYLGVFGSILAIARGMVPEENLVFDPEASLMEVIRWTHYLPGEWTGKLHSQMVHSDFGTLFSNKITIFFTELLSVLLTPLILLFSLPPCAGAIIDFFREFSVHVDGVGYVCSFAVFDFRQYGKLSAAPADALSPAQDASRTGLKPGRSATRPAGGLRENKMEKSFLHFKATHPDWQPADPSSSVFLDRLVGLHRDQMASHPPPPSHVGPNGMSGSTYAGGRGLGVGGWAMDDSKLRERSRSYDRAWARSTQLLRSSPSNVRSPTENGKLETMRENEEVEEDEEETEGWNKKLAVDSDGEEDGEDEDEKGFLRDVGMIGLLQQVMGR